MEKTHSRAESIIGTLCSREADVATLRTTNASMNEPQRGVLALRQKCTCTSIDIYFYMAILNNDYKRNNI